MIHAFVVWCMALNSTMCFEQETVPFDYRPITSVMDCAMGGMIFGMGHLTQRDGIVWVSHGVKCRMEGSLPPTKIQQRLRASISD